MLNSDQKACFVLLYAGTATAVCCSDWLVRLSTVSRGEALVCSSAEAHARHCADSPVPAHGGRACPVSLALLPRSAPLPPQPKPQTHHAEPRHLQLEPLESKCWSGPSLRAAVDLHVEAELVPVACAMSQTLFTVEAARSVVLVFHVARSSPKFNGTWRCPSACRGCIRGPGW